MRVEVNPIFQDVISDLLDCPADYLVYRGGGGSGKSTGIAQAIVYLCSTKRNFNVLALRKRREHARTSVFAEFRKWIVAFGLTHKFRINMTTMTIYCPSTDSYIVCTGSSNPEDLKSITLPSGIFSIAWMEEATQFTWSTDTTKNDIDQIRMRLRGENGYQKRIILSFNPVSKEHWIKSAMMPAYKHVERVYTYEDNAFIDTAYVEFLTGLMVSNPNAHRIYALGEWGDLKTGLVFPDWKVVPRFDAPITDTFYGMDFGWSKGKTTLVRCDVSEYSKVHLTELIYQSKLGIEETIKMVRDSGIGKRPLYCDSASPEKIFSLRKAGIDAQLSRKGFSEGVETMELVDISYSPESKNLHAERIEYAYKEGKMEPDGSPDHLLDAVRYAINTHYLTMKNYNKYIAKKYGKKVAA